MWQLKEINDKGGIPLEVMGRNVRVKVWVQTIVGDISGNNNLLGHYNGSNITCPYRDCTCAKETFLDPNASCSLITKAEVDLLKQTNDKDALKAASTIYSAQRNVALIGHPAAS